MLKNWSQCTYVLNVSLSLSNNIPIISTQFTKNMMNNIMKFEINKFTICVEIIL